MNWIQDMNKCTGPAAPTVSDMLDEMERARQSKHEAWRHASELEEDRVRLTAEVERLRTAMREAMPFCMNLGMQLLSDALEEPAAQVASVFSFRGHIPLQGEKE